MRDVRAGKTDELHVDCVTYYLSDSKDVFRVINEISRATGGIVKIGELPYVFRYARGNEETGEVLVVVCVGKDDECSRVPKKEDNVKAGELENHIKQLLNGLNYFEMENGLYAVEPPLDDAEELSRVCSKLLCADADIWLYMGDCPQRIAFKPDYIEDKYVLAQYIIPCIKKDSDEVKSVKELEIPLC